ncbi:MAG: c-type cytochrome biogenesis protein CcsB [Candidatus Dormibacteraeota bacterium]|nr:c-type cytochrome biogenesis protein CcsB [Candidatus Dormibacteraeota bacterium]MBV9525000.1 c-type cytochrome biogenesis protein CcsB [Candidatus Dormibacteraeota bacterium]
MGSTPASLVLFGVAVGAYCVALLFFVLHVALRRRWLGDVGLGLVVAGWPLHLASIFTRALEAGHWPLGNMYEYSTGISFVVVTVCLVLMIRARMRLIGLPAMIVAIALMGVAYMLYVPPGQLVPALHSYWLTIHVTAMATSSAVLSFSFFFGMGYLARRWADQRMLAVATAPAAAGVDSGGAATLTMGGGAGGGLGGASSAFADRLRRILPSARALDLWSYRFVMIGFPIWSFGVICGAIWGEHAWGRYWGWDPKETFAFITWVVFAIYLHARVTYGWKEKRAAIITAFGFAAILFTLYAVNLWIAGLHSYARA